MNREGSEQDYIVPFLAVKEPYLRNDLKKIFKFFSSHLKNDEGSKVDDTKTRTPFSSRQHPIDIPVLTNNYSQLPAHTLISHSVSMQGCIHKGCQSLN